MLTQHDNLKRTMIGSVGAVMLSLGCLLAAAAPVNAEATPRPIVEAIA